MRVRSVTAVLAALLTIICVAPLATGAAPRAPNVIFFLVDDWGWTDAACYGSRLYETPHIDRLATQGMRFTQAYSACTVCSPTRAAVMTGKYPARLHLTDWIAGHKRPFAKLKIPDWTQQLPLAEVTIAEELKMRGYATAIVGKWHLGEESYYPDRQGFDVNFGGGRAGQPGSYFPPYRIPVADDGQPGEFLTDRLTREAISFIERNKDRPFFLYFPHYAVHTPLAGKPEVVAKYRRKIEAGKFNQTNPVYAALVESVDDSVGAVMQKLDELKIADRTVVFLTGDNGGLSGSVNAQGWRPGPTRNDPLRLGKGSAYEGGVRVPMIVKWANVTAPGSVNEVPVISVDFFPTILELVDGRPPTAPTDGESIAPLLTGSARLTRGAIYWHYPHYHPGSATPYSAIRDGNWKLIHFFEDNRVELYNLKDDVGEKSDLASANPEKAAALLAKLTTWRTAVGAQLPTKNPNYDPARTWDSNLPAAANAGRKQSP